MVMPQNTQGGFEWPQGVQSAVTLTIDLDFDTPWQARDPEFSSRPLAQSMARYGPQVGVPLLLSMLEDLGVEATFFVPGKSAEDYPETVQSIIAAGHEIAVHGYTHEPPARFTRDQEEDQLRRSLAILQGLGAEVAGYRAPFYEVSVHTIGLLQKYGLGYSSNLMDDVKPYRHSDSGVVELPVHWIMDDWLQFSHGLDDWLAPNATCARVRELWLEEFLGVHAHGGLFVLTLHPQVIGRPSRVQMLKGFVEEMKDQGDVWVTTCGAIAATMDSVG
jgi:peptidoglycan/xylan/chitin deacetylase (PgdA/CDA1 family)